MAAGITLPVSLCEAVWSTRRPGDGVNFGACWTVSLLDDAPRAGLSPSEEKLLWELTASDKEPRPPAICNLEPVVR